MKLIGTPTGNIFTIFTIIFQNYPSGSMFGSLVPGLLFKNGKHQNSINNGAIIYFCFQPIYVALLAQH
jgi:hypothetical protein